MKKNCKTASKKGGNKLSTRLKSTQRIKSNSPNEGTENNEYAFTNKNSESKQNPLNFDQDDRFYGPDIEVHHSKIVKKEIVSIKKDDLDIQQNSKEHGYHWNFQHSEACEIQSHTAVKQTDSGPKQRYPNLTPEMRKKVEEIWETPISSLKRLKPDQMQDSYLNDEIINSYIKLIQEREKELNHRIHIFNTYFFDFLEHWHQGKKNFESIIRITNRARVRISECNFVFIPINANRNHWVFVEVDVSNRKATYQDSLPASESKAIERLQIVSAYLRKIIQFEKDSQLSVEKSEKEISKLFLCYVKMIMIVFTVVEGDNFTLNINKNYPQQKNTLDCGVFMLKGIEFRSRLAECTFMGDDSRDFRYLITYELDCGKLLSN